MERRILCRLLQYWHQSATFILWAISHKKEKGKIWDFASVHTQPHTNATIKGSARLEHSKFTARTLHIRIMWFSIILCTLFLNFTCIGLYSGHFSGISNDNDDDDSMPTIYGCGTSSHPLYMNIFCLFLLPMCRCHRKQKTKTKKHKKNHSQFESNSSNR